MESVEIKPRHTAKRKNLNRVKVQTTLYELTETVIDAVGTDENELINKVIRNLLIKGRP